MGWFFLVIAGVLEIGWTISLKYTAGFTRPLPILCYALFGAGSAWFLALAMKHIPMATAYVVWMGIGLVGAAAYDAIWLEERLNLLKVVSMALILAGAVGIRISDDVAGKALRPAPSASGVHEEPAGDPGELRAVAGGDS